MRLPGRLGNSLAATVDGRPPLRRFRGHLRRLGVVSGIGKPCPPEELPKLLRGSRERWYVGWSIPYDCDPYGTINAYTAYGFPKAVRDVEGELHALPSEWEDWVRIAADIWARWDDQALCVLVSSQALGATVRWRRRDVSPWDIRDCTDYENETLI